MNECVMNNNKIKWHNTTPIYKSKWKLTQDKNWDFIKQYYIFSSIIQSHVYCKSFSKSVQPKYLK